MEKILKLIVPLIFVSSFSYSQLTIKDFKLCLDNVECTDTLLLITKDQLLKSKKIIPNFSWFTIESAVIYTGDITIVNSPNDEFNDAGKKIFERLSPNSIVTITVKGHNKQNIQVDWGTLFIKIIDKN